MNPKVRRQLIIEPRPWAQAEWLAAERKFDLQYVGADLMLLQKNGKTHTVRYWNITNRLLRARVTGDNTPLLQMLIHAAAQLVMDGAQSPLIDGALLTDKWQKAYQENLQKSPPAKHLNGLLQAYVVWLQTEEELE